ncbi:MAG: hypothetical protein EHM43_12810 [Ignavibacteriae bacterium]|nr:MAG: hypothetical protein EHM43_12810 [Ignavibacteriota bacterium]
MADLTALDVIQNMSLDMTMAIVRDLGTDLDTDDKSRAIANLVATDLLYRFNNDYSMAQQFASNHGLKLTVTLA